MNPGRTASENIQSNSGAIQANISRAEGFSPDLSALSTKAAGSIASEYLGRRNELAMIFEESSSLRITNMGEAFVVESKPIGRSDNIDVATSLRLMTVDPLSGTLKNVTQILIDGDITASAVNPDKTSYLVATEGMVGLYEINTNDKRNPLKSVGYFYTSGGGEDRAASIEFIDNNRAKVNFADRSVTLVMGKGSLKEESAENPLGLAA